MSDALITARAGRAAVVRAARELQAAARSVPEGVLWTACHEVGLPTPTLNAPITTVRGIRWADAYWEDCQLVAEIDGREHHSKESDLINDRRRQELLEDLGLTVLRFPASTVLYRPELVLIELMPRLGVHVSLAAWMRQQARLARRFSLETSV
jgi:very-short-patch-repair endonuclease